jgi:hypothetical protein
MKVLRTRSLLHVVSFSISGARSENETNGKAANKKKKQAANAIYVPAPLRRLTKLEK